MKSRQRSSSARSPWLTLGEASQLLGVTPATLRRWADRGQVSSFVTPGGHRRFPRAVIESLIPSRTAPNRGFSGAAIAAAYGRHREHGQVKLPPWIAELSESERVEFRDRGRALLKVLLEHLDTANPRQSRARLDEAAALAAEYGARAARLGASLSETVQGFLFFRAPFVGELARQSASRGLTTREATALLVRAEAAMDRLLSEVMNSFR